MKSIVEVDLNERGFGTVIIDGVDMSNKVTRMEFDCKANDLTSVRITLAPCVVRVKAPALVEIEPIGVEVYGAGQVTEE